MRRGLVPSELKSEECAFPAQPHCEAALTCILFIFNFKKDFIHLLLERGEGREKERERNISV